MSHIFELPDVGEGLTEADILSWKVAPGDTVAINDVLVEIETAKSVVELPSPYAGVVDHLLAAEGETVEVGNPIISIAPVGSTADHQDAAPTTSTPLEAESPTAALVGTGPKADAVKRRARKRPVGGGRLGATAAATAPVSAPATVPTVRAEAAVEEQKLLRNPLASWSEKASALIGEGLKKLPVSQDRGGEGGKLTVPRRPTLAKPPVRKAAQDMGVDLADVTGTGDQGQVTKRDLLDYVAHLKDAEEEVNAGSDSFWLPAGRGDRIERIKVRGVRKATAKAMVDSAFTAPHVSIFVDVDATRTMEFVKRLKKSQHFEGIKVTPLLILAKAVIWATARTPQVNAHWTGSEIHIKHFMNLGIAAATPRGLLVPNIKDAQNLSLRELAIALNELTSTAREGKTQPADMADGTFTITNIGSLGIDTGTPIINPGEAAILAFGTIKQKPWVVDGEVIPRYVTTLGGSFDHRILDGDLAARFVADVAAVLEEPALLLDE